MHTERRRNAFLRERAKFFETRSENIRQCWKHYKTREIVSEERAENTKITNMYEQNTENHTKPRVIYAKIRFAQNRQQIRKYAQPPKTL